MSVGRGEHASRTRAADLIIGYAITVLASVIVFLGEAYLIIVFYIGVAVLIWTSIRAVVGLDASDHAQASFRVGKAALF